MEVLLTAKDAFSVSALEEFMKANPAIKSHLVYKNKESAQYDMDLYRKPIPTFKHFCGPEWLNQAGFISAKSALQRIMIYIRSNELFQPDTTRIRFDEVLISFFGGIQGTVYERHLPELVKRLLD
jgi:hypothetical protein